MTLDTKTLARLAVVILATIVPTAIGAIAHIAIVAAIEAIKTAPNIAAPLKISILKSEKSNIPLFHQISLYKSNISASIPWRSSSSL